MQRHSKQIFFTKFQFYFKKLQHADESLRFYKGNDAAHDEPSGSDPFTLKKLEIEDGNKTKLADSSEDNENDLNSPLTLKDFCTFQK